MERSSQAVQQKITVCPICQGSSDRLFNKDHYWVRGCRACHHRFLELGTDIHHVKQVYGDSYFQGGGAGYPDYLAEAAILRRHGQRYARLLSRYMPSGRMLDVGSAAGFILKEFVGFGWQGQGLEPNLRMVDYARTHLNLQVEVGTLEQMSGEGTYDLITMIQVVAHFFDFQQALATANLKTNPGGYWLIETWNRESWMARLLGKSWHEYSPPSVLQWFSPKGICQVAAQNGFREVARGRPAKWIGGAHAKSLLRYKLQGVPLEYLFSRCLEWIPDTLTLPYPAEDLFWILFQKSSL
jgi:2-polyprenyl-3-methyl-5-hydroxy-6-metoxy-1,4-benzoquinol methylase